MADPLLDPPPPLGPLDLGLSEPPQAPAVPQFGAPPPDFKAKLLRLIAAGIAGGLGPGAGTGLLQGIQQADQQKARDQQIKDQQARLLYSDQQQQYAQQARAYEQEADQRRAAFERTVQQLERVAPTLKSKADFDRTVDVYAQGLGNYGIRNAGLQLRQRVLYAEPKAADRANAILEKFFGDKVNQRLLDNPEQLQNRTWLVDLDGDGQESRVSLAQLLRVAKRTELLDPATGKLGLLPKGTTPEMKAGVDARYQELLTIARADGKIVDGDSAPAARNRVALMDQAKRADKEAGDLGPDPLLTEMRAMRIEQLKRQQNVPDMSPVQFNMANKLADDFTRDSKDFVTRAQSYGTVLAATKDPSAAGDLSLIFAYMKMLDPGSVVREGEFATAQNTAGVPDRIRVMYNRILSGERLAPAQRDDFLKQGRAIYLAAKQRQDAIVRMYTQRALRSKLPPEMVVFDFSEGVEQPAPGLDAPGTPAPDGNVWERGPDGQLRKKGTP